MMTEDEAPTWTEWKAWVVFGQNNMLFEETVRDNREDADRLCGPNSTVRPVLIFIDQERAASQGGQTSE